MAKNEEQKVDVKEKKKRPCVLCHHPLPSHKFRCTTCGTWNLPGASTDTKDETVLLSEVPEETFVGIPTGPWDECFSIYGGIVNVQVALLGGQPGAGKSTLSLQMADAIAGFMGREVLYVAKEEDSTAVKVRAVRIHLRHLDKIRIYPIHSRADLGIIVEKFRPGALFIDSVPGVTSENDAVEMAKILKSDFATRYKMPVIMIDHVNKDEELAGKLALQHAVDVTVKLTRLSDDPKDPFRYMMSEKNRFGPPAECYLRMTAEHGLVLHEMEADTPG